MVSDQEFARLTNFDDPRINHNEMPDAIKYSTPEQRQAWMKAAMDWLAKPKAAGGGSPFLDYTRGYGNVPAVSAYGTGNTPPHWTALYGAIQSGRAKIQDGTVVDAAGNPTAGSVTEVAPGVYKIRTTSGQYSSDFLVGTDPKTGYVSPITDMSKQYASWRHDYSGGGLSGVIGDLVQGLSDMGPLGKLALAYGVAQTGGALGGALGIGSGLGTALASTGLQVSQGADLGSALTSAATGAITGAIGQGIGSAISDTGLFNIGDSTKLPDLPAIDTGTTGSLYDLSSAGTTGGLGIQATPGTGTNLFAPAGGVEGGGLGLQMPSSVNLADMGGALGLTIPAAGGGVLSAAGVGTPSTVVTNPVTGQPMGQELSNINTGVTDVTGATPTTSNPITNQVIKSAIGSLMADNTSNAGSGLLSGVGSAIQGQISKEAAQALADRLAAATGSAVAGSQFRPVGITTRFGSSNFQVNPQTGQLESAGYTPSALSEQLQQGAQGVYNLGQGYVAQSPQEAAQSWLQAQQNLLAPSRDVALANLRNKVFQSGREGLSVAQGGDLQAANPEMAAYYNSLANQNALLASQAQQFGQQQAQFGTGLLGSGLNLMSGLNTLEQQPLALGASLGQQAAGAGANAGRLGLTGTGLGQDYLYKAMTYSPLATLFSGAGNNPLANQAVSGLLSQYVPQLGNWLSGLMSPAGGIGTGSLGETNYWSY